MAGFVRFLHTIKPQVLIGYKGSIFDRFIVFSGYYYQGCHDRKVAPPKHILWGYEHIVGLGVHRQLKALSVSDGAF